MPQIAPLVAGDPVRLGPFTLSGRIGEGGQGTVYLGYNAMGERAAVKLLHVKFSGDAAARSRFARELKAAERVASFCTARVIAADLDGDTPYIASEYIEGRSLREAVEADGPLRGATLDRLAIGTATALTAIHHAGIVHRDFKPDNVLIAADGPRVVDFGIARIIDSTGTITSRAIGTPAYMAPEQISGGTVGPHTDVFSWASTIMFAATGQVAFHGDSIAVVLNRILNHDVDAAMLPEPLRGVVRSCLSKVPAERPTADQILLRLLGHSGGARGASSDVLNAGAQAAGAEQVGAAAASPASAPVDPVPPTRRQPRPQAMPMPQTGFRASPPTGPAGGTRAGVESGSFSGPHTGIFGPPAAPPPAPPPAPPRPTSPPPPPHSPSSPSSPAPSPSPSPPPSPPNWGGQGVEGTRSLSEAGTEIGYGGEPPRRRSRRVIVGTVVAALLAAGGVVGYAQLQGGDEQDPPPNGQSAVSGAGERARESLVDRARRSGKIAIGVKGDLPGIGLLSQDRFSGFEIDFARLIAQRLQVPDAGVSLVRVGRADRLTAVTGGKVDMVLATWPVNKADAARVDFVGPYYVAHTGVMVKNGDPYERLADLAGKRLCAPQGSASIRVVQEAVSMRVVSASDLHACMELINSGAVDAIPGEDVILAGFGNRNHIAMKILPDRLDNLRYAVAIRRGDTRACRAISDAIDDIYSSGAASRVLGEHFGQVDFTPATRAPARGASTACG